MTRIVLHIGAPKTGTTAIQGYLSHHEAALRASGVNFVRSGRRHIAHNALPRIIRAGGAPEFFEGLQSEISDFGPGVQIISSELLFGPAVGQTMAQAFAAHMDSKVLKNTTVVCYLRRHDRYVEALYKQKVKNGKAPPDPRRFLEKEYARLSYSDVLNAYAAVFSKDRVIARPFDRSQFPGGDVVQDFVRLLDVPGLETFKAASPTQTNRTLSVEISEILGQFSSNTKANTRQLIREIISMDQAAAFASNDVFDRAMQRQIVEHFADDAQQIEAWNSEQTQPFFDRSDLDADVETPADADAVCDRWRVASGIVAQAIGRLEAQA